MPSPAGKLLLALGSAAAAAVVGAALLRARGEERPTVATVDTRAGLADAFAARDAAADPRAIPGGIPRLRVPPKVAERFFPAIGVGQVYDPDMVARHKPSKRFRQRLAEHPRRGWRLVTNSLGLRDDDEVAAEKPDARVLVVGDSHVDGVCDNADGFPQVLERALAAEHPERSIEVLNGGTGGWSFYNYLGALEAWADLAPDVFVVTVYGGNDFYGALDLHHYHRREPLPARDTRTVAKLVRLSKENMGIPSQFYNQVAYFHDHPDEEAAALAMAVDVTAEIARRCAELGAKLLVVYLPPYAHGQPERYAPYLALAQEHLPLPAGAVAVDERLADAWLARLAADGVRTVDLRPAFRAAEEALYWESDHHVGLAGQRRIAAELHAAVAELAELDEVAGLDR
jgi:lysophospholipase L1-like esterase